MKYPCRGLAAFVGVLLTAGQAVAAAESGSASVFMYHRFGEPQYPSTSISIAQLEAHIAELTSGRYRVMALEAVVEHLITGKPLPDRAVAITIDDGFVSAYREAWPRLRAAGLPFTLFISTDSLDEKQPGAMNWDQLREMIAGGGVGIGHHGAAHQHMPQTDGAAKRADIAKASKRFEAELGLRPDIFAYPYGEYGASDRDLIESLGFRAAMAEQSGVAYGGADRFALPRFAMNIKYAEKERFRLAANALPLPVTELTPSDPLLSPENNPPLLGFTVDATIPGLDRLACYASDQKAPLKVQQLGQNRIEARMTKPFAPGHGRINCTLPGGQGRWRWLGLLYVISRE